MDRNIGNPPRLREYMAVLAFFVMFYVAYFSPVLLSGRLLAPGDGSVSYLPDVAHGWSLWVDDILAGYPAFADSQFLLWYPLRVFGSHYNVLVISAYVIAAFCTYGLARLLSGSVLAAIVAGLIYSGGGFMTAHLGHLSIIHAAAWIPLTVWGLEALSRSRGWACVAMVAFGVALSFLGGHPQIWVYGMMFAAAYSVWRSATLHGHFRWPDGGYLVRSGVGIAAGIAIAAVQLLPFAEFTRLAARGTWTYTDYISYSLPPIELSMAVFPNLFGNVLGGYGPMFGAPSATELAFYAGIVPLALAWLAPWSATARGRTGFWVGAGLIAVAYMTADATPLGRLGFNLPMLGSFRALGRAGIFYDLSVAILAALAIAALQDGDLAGKRLRRGLLTGAVALSAVLVIVAHVYPVIVAQAQMAHVAIPDMWHNKAIWVPLVFLGCGLVLCMAPGRWRRPALAALVVVIALDLASFGWFYEWRVNTAPPISSAAPGWQTLIDEARREHARILPLQRFDAAMPNRNLLYGLPSASGYVSLMPKRFGEMASVGVTGHYPAFASDSPFWDLLGVRWRLGTASAAIEAGYAKDANWRPLATPLPNYPHALERVDFGGRAWLVGGIIEADDPEALETIQSEVTYVRKRFDPREVALIESGTTLPYELGRWGKAGDVDTRQVSEGRWRFAVHAQRPALLVISQMDYPGWQASVNGKPAQVLRANYALQAVAVDTGESVVELSFMPRSFVVGALLSLLGLLVVAACLGSAWLSRMRSAISAR